MEKNIHVKKNIEFCKKIKYSSEYLNCIKNVCEIKLTDCKGDKYELKTKTK